MAWGARTWSACSLGYARQQRCAQQPNAVGVKLRLAATESRPRLLRRAARCQLQLLVGRTAHRGGLRRFFPTRTLWRLCRVIPPASGLVPPRTARSAARARVYHAPEASHNCPGDSHRPSPGWWQAHHPPGRRPPAVWISCRALPSQYGGRSPSTRDHPCGHQHLTAGWTPFRMPIAPLRIRRLPIQTHRNVRRRLPKGCATVCQGRSVRVVIQPIAPHHARLGHRHMQQLCGEANYVAREA